MIEMSLQFQFTMNHLYRQRMKYQQIRDTMDMVFFNAQKGTYKI